jgi:signal transduction histidine kinase
VLTTVIAAGLGAVAALAIVAAGAAIWRARTARRAGDEHHRESVVRGAALEADSRVIDDAAHDLNDLLTAITGHAELLIASLDPSGAGMRDAHAIRQAALSAARLTKPLRTLSSGRRAPTDVIDVNAVTARTVASLQPMLGAAITWTRLSSASACARATRCRTVVI